MAPSAGAIEPHGSTTMDNADSHTGKLAEAASATPRPTTQAPVATAATRTGRGPGTPGCSRDAERSDQAGTATCNASTKHAALQTTPARPGEGGVPGTGSPMIATVAISPAMTVTGKLSP